MPASNTSPGTALDLAPLGTTVTILAADVQGAPDGTLYASTCDATQHHALWFKYTTGPSDLMLSVGIKGAEAGDAYKPMMSVWTGTPPSVTQHKVLTATGGLLNNLCANMATAVSRSDIWYLSFPVTGNTTYYFQVTDANATTVTTDLNVVGVAAPVLSAAKPGDYLIINDAGPFPSAVVDQTTGSLLGYISLGVGEEGTGLPSGQMAFQDTAANAGAGGLQIVNNDLSTVTTINTLPVNVLNSATVFYLVTFTGDTAHVQLVKPDGTLGALINVPNVGAALMVSNDSSTFYYVDDSTFTLVKRWDLVNNLALPDFAGNFGGAEPTYAFISGVSQTIVITYSGSPKVMRQWSPNGALLRTDNLTIAPFTRMIGDFGSDTFQTWSGLTDFHRYGIWDPNTELVGVNTVGAQSSNGGPQNVPYAISTSCPLLVIPSASPISQPVPQVGTEETRPLVRVRQVGLEAFPGNVAQFIGRAEVQMQPGLGVPADPTQAPVISMAWSGDNAVTFNTEQPLSLGRTGDYYTRAYKHVVGGGPDMRQPACKISCSDDVTFVPTDLFVTREAGTG